MTRLVIIIGVIGLLSFVGCGSKSSSGSSSVPQEISVDDRKAPLVLEKVKEFRFDFISKEGPSLMRVDDKDHLFVFVFQNKDGNCEIFKYGGDDFQLKTRKVIRRGQGPSEALNPRTVGGGRETLVIYDGQGKKYLQYDGDLNYVAEYRAKVIGEYYDSGGIYLPKHRFLVDAFTNDSGIDREIRHRVVARDFYNSKDTELFEIKAPWARKAAGKLIFTITRPLHFTVLNDHYFFLDKKKYRIVKMNLDGEIVKDIKIKFTPIAVPRSLRKEWIAKLGPKKRLIPHMDYDEYVFPVLWIIPFAEGVLIGRCTNHDPDNKGPVMADFFDKDLNFKGKVELPYFAGWNNPSGGNSSAVSSLHCIERKLYAVDERNDDEYWLTLWQVKPEVER